MLAHEIAPDALAVQTVGRDAVVSALRHLLALDREGILREELEARLEALRDPLTGR